MKNSTLTSILITACLSGTGITAQNNAALLAFNNPKSLTSKMGFENTISVPAMEPAVIKPGMITKKLGITINSNYCEIGPLLSGDGKTLYFSRYLDPANTGGKEDEEDIWYSEWDEKTNSWGAAKNIGAPLNNKYPNYINSISPDGNSIIVGNTYLPGGEMTHGISISRKTQNGWSAPEKIVIDGNSCEEWAGVYLSNSQKTMILSQHQRKNSFGELDLYVSFAKTDNTWSKPVNLGAVINTKGIESAPFLSADERTLYFTSDGMGGYGGSDIFMSTRIDDSWQNWSAPVNMGQKINTAADESFFTVSADGNRIYFTSEGETPGNHDIFMLDVPKTEQPAEVKPASEKTASESEYAHNSYFKANTMYFDFEKTDLKAETMAELDRIAEFLSGNGSSRVEVIGYTDNIGSKQYNYELSLKRAQAVAAYLKSKTGAKRDLFVVKSFADADPAGDNDTKEGRKLNRRVEINITNGVMFRMN